MVWTEQRGRNADAEAPLEEFDRIEVEVLRAFVREMKRLDPGGGAEELPLAGGLLLAGGRHAPPIHLLAGAGGERPLTAGELERAAAFFRQKGAAGYVWSLDGLSGDLADVLERAGWRRDRPHTLFRYPLEWPLPDVATAGEVEVREVEAGELEELLVMAARCWLEKQELSAEELLIGRAFSAIDFGRVFGAWVEGELAAYAHLFLLGDAATLHGACTLLEARRHGAQQALITARLRAAAEAGCRVAWLAGPEGGPTERNADRLGFQRMGVRRVYRTPEAG
jgi:hypothetical protein